MHNVTGENVDAEASPSLSVNDAPIEAYNRAAGLGA